jgi:hypothetical protein
MTLPQNIRESFERQAGWCRELGSPFTGLVCEVLATRLDDRSRFGARLHAWPSQPTADALPLRAAGALNALARSGNAVGLARVYPPSLAPNPDELWSATAAAIASHDDFLHDYLDSAPQTNEVARSVTILAGCLAIASLHRLPLEILEIGASAGLNLGFDRYRYAFGEAHWGEQTSPVRLAPRWEGALPPLDAPLAIAARAGCDISPLDPASSTDRARLLSYIWPDQTQRLARIEAALDMAASAPWRIERADAGEWVERQLGARPQAGRMRVLVHSIMWQYMPQETQARINRTLAEAAATASPDAPLAWLRLEPDGLSDGAALSLDLWPGGRRLALGRADYHGRWVRFAEALGR